MFGFLAVLIVSVALVLLVQAMDIEGVNPPKRRRTVAKVQTTGLPHGTVLTGLR